MTARIERRGGARPGSGRKPGPQIPKPTRVGPTAIQAAVTSLGHLATPHYLAELGFRLSQIHAAVRRGEIAWTRDGSLEVRS